MIRQTRRGGYRLLANVGKKAIAFIHVMTVIVRPRCVCLISELLFPRIANSLIITYVEWGKVC
jgi:hypothetical protein